MNYLPLVMIGLKHSFFDHGRCADFSIIPDPKTAGLLNNHRCVIRPDAYGLRVYVPVANQQPMIPFADDLRLFFDCTLRHDEFCLYSDRRVERSNPLELQICQAGSVVTQEQDFIVTGNSTRLLFTIAITRDFNQINAAENYVDEVRFFAKPVQWVYFVVTDLTSTEQLVIVDDGQSVDKTTWRRYIPPTSDRIFINLSKQYPSMSVICFISEQTLECRESCNHLLRLMHGEHAIFEQLPGPSYLNYFPMEALAGSKSVDAIYQIVKFFTNTTLIKG